MDRPALPKIVDQDPPTRSIYFRLLPRIVCSLHRSRYQSVNWTGPLASPSPTADRNPAEIRTSSRNPTSRADWRTPEAASRTIMTYFFFGTLMDLDVLATVLRSQPGVAARL
jgi:hypothetical protein